MSKQAATEQMTVEKVAVATAIRPAKGKPRLLPPFKVILHTMTRTPSRT
jgi:hypothetical protein